MSSGHTIFRKPDKNKEKEDRAHEVHILHESEIGFCVKTCIGKWLDTCEGLLGCKLEPEECIFPKLTARGCFQQGEKMTHKYFSNLLKKWLDMANAVAIVGGQIGF